MGITERWRWYLAGQDRTRILLLKHLSKIKRMANTQGGSANAGVNQSLAFWGGAALRTLFPPSQVAEGLGAVVLANLPFWLLSSPTCWLDGVLLGDLKISKTGQKKPTNHPYLKSKKHPSF